MTHEATEIAKLAERVEAATSGSIDLDEAIELIVFYDDPLSPRSFTASLDAAMSLVPEGWDRMEVYPPTEDYSGWTVHTCPNRHTIEEWGEGYAASFPLALCAAALKARAILSEKGEQA